MAPENSAAAAAPQRSPSKRSSITPEDIAEARAEIARAFNILGLFDGNNPVCPECGSSKKGKVKLFDDGGWICYKSYHNGQESGRNAIDLLCWQGYSFADAVATLLGRPVQNTELATRVKVMKPVDYTASSFDATVDSEVYAAFLTGPWCSLRAAQDFYGTWFIDPQAVAEAGARVLVDAKTAYAEMLRLFDQERLVQAGMCVESDYGNDIWWLVNDRYPVVEPHLWLDGSIVGMQFRASATTAEQAKSYSGRKAEWESQREALVARNASEKELAVFDTKRPKFVAKFFSLKGGTRDHLVGCGLWRVGQLADDSAIYIVEGFKDMLAARTMGAEAYAIPGVGVMPPQKVLDYFAAHKHRLVLCLDADAAGEEGQENLAQLLTKNEIAFKVKTDIPAGMDVTDLLVARNT